MKINVKLPLKAGNCPTWACEWKTGIYYTTFWL